MSENKDILQFKYARKSLENKYKLKIKNDELKKKYNKELRDYSKTIKKFIKEDLNKRNNIIDKFDKILDYYKLKTYFMEKETKSKALDNLLKKEKEIKNKIREVKIKLISEKSWYNQINEMDDKTHRALTEWLSLKNKYGTGHGKRANLIRKEMQEKMEYAKDAIPIWIMPVDKVIEQYTFKAEPQFDVVIMDESSQSSIISITALLRGKKCIIVGDDKQISPMEIGISTENILELQRRYLAETRLGVGYSLDTSIYDLAQIVCGSNKVVLKEHFRCLPEIIGFSNKYFYNGKINCLKTRNKENNLKKAIETVFVENATVEKYSDEIINFKEIDYIIRKLKEIEKNEEYNDKTIGIIVLQNSNKHLSMIISEIWKNFSNQFMQKRKIKVGTAYDFQGDERDVIILSMVNSLIQSNGEKNRIQPMTKKIFERSFNVASSRAKEQVILFYSIKPEFLSKECLRYKLINYYLTYNLEKEKSKEKLFESNFERDVYRFLNKEGFELTPQFKVGKYRIDFVLENDEGIKIAIECDGDKYHTIEEYENDLIRQEVLERCGWIFIRIRASQYYYDQENTKKYILERIDDIFEEN